MADWYRTHSASPEAYSEAEYLGWAQDSGLFVDAAGNVDYGPPESVTVVSGSCNICRNPPSLCACWDEE